MSSTSRCSPRWRLGPRPKTCLPFRLRAASLGKVSRKKFGRLRLVPKTGLSAELLGYCRVNSNGWEILREHRSRIQPAGAL